MNKITIISICISALAVFALSCSNDHRTPGRIYMPDMAYSRAYESYADRDSAEFTMNRQKLGGKIFYNAVPVTGTMKRGTVNPYPIQDDIEGYVLSASVQNPFPAPLSKGDLQESGRLFNIYCGVCHGAGAAGNGPLSTGGKIGGVANLTLPNYVDMADGTMFYATEYGKGIMGSYASQVSREQRWKIIKYIRTLQKGGAPVADSSSKGGAAVDSTKKI